MNDNRIHYLDGLRGILALIVFLHHFLYLFHPELMLGGSINQFLQPGITIRKIIALTPVNIFFNPSMAINFFFLLSGFVQSYHYFKTPNLRLVQTSFIKRYFRLAVPMLAVLILIFIFRKAGFIHKELLPANSISAGWIKNQLPDTLNFFQLIKYGLADCFLGDRSYYQVLWTMPIELINSWMVLILLFVTHRVKNKNVVFVFWIFIQTFLMGSTHGISFTVGLLLCSLHLHSLKFNRFFSKPIIKYSSLIIGLYFASYPIIAYEGAAEKSIYKFIMFFNNDVYNYIIGNIFLFCFILFASGLKHILSKKLFQFYGNISFMFYLVHFLLLFSFSAILYSSLQYYLSLANCLFVTFLLTLALTSVVSVLLYKWIDKPFLKLCNKSARKLLGI